MIENEKNRFLYYITNSAKDEKSSEKLKIIVVSVIENRNKKRRDFQKAVKKFKNDENYEFIDPLIEGHFSFKAVQELNEKVIKDREGYLTDFTDRIYDYFNNQTILYWKINGCYNDDGVLDDSLANKNFHCLDQVIEENTNDEKFIPWIEKLETNLPITYIDIPC